MLPAERSRPLNSVVARLATVATCLFLPACASSRPTVLPDPVPVQEQRLRPGDMLRIDVWRQLEYSGEFSIGIDGRLLHPLYQELELEGLSAEEARREVEHFLTGYVSSARIVVEPLFRVSVGGEVREPAVYPMVRGSTVAEAVAVAGGPTALAKLDEVVLVRDGVQYALTLGQDDLITFGQVPVTSDFELWRDVIGPVATLAALTLSVIRIGNESGR
jgi:polysaccharide export outer membrane protein